jgi:two-component system, cell cycle sensor histidine kinase and response regulator CckA
VNVRRSGAPTLDELIRVAEELPHVVWISHPDNRTEYVNARGAEYLGMEAGETYDDAWARSVHPDDHVRAESVWQQARAAGEPYLCEYRLKAATGAYRWNAARAHPVRDGDDEGRVVWWLGTCTDIEDRVSAETALHESESRWQALAAAGTEGVIIHDGDTIIDVNDAVGELFGYERRDLIGRPASQLPLDGLDETPRDLRCSRVDGTAMVVEASSGIFSYHGGIACVTTLRDVTRQRRIERERDNLAQLAERSGDGISLTRLDGALFYLNAAGRALVGLGDRPLHGMRVEDLSYPEDAGRLQQEVLPKLLQDGTWRGTWRYRQLETGDPVDVDILSFVVRDERTGEPRFVATISRDLTERLRLEEQLQHAQKMEAAKRLAGGVAHDFNNVLTVVRGYTQLLLESMADDDPARVDVGEIAAAVDRAGALTAQLFSFGRREPVAPRVLDLDEIVRDMERLLGRIVGDDVRFVMRLSPALGNVCADPGQIEQVILNLVVNACDAMPSGGTISLATNDVDLDEPLPDGLLGAPAGAYVSIAVTDTGAGIVPEARRRMFEPFFTTKPAPAGTGLGLATVYGIVDGLGGDLRVLSQPGRGSRFEVYLPRVAADVQPHPRPPVTCYGNETILLVEDEPAVRAVVRRMLLGLGYGVVEADGPVAALELLAAEAAAVDILLTDVVMPAMSGPDLAVQVRRAQPGVGVLYMSGFNDRQVDGPLLRKPFSVEELGTHVRLVLDAARRGAVVELV